jgi:hypothetical protein
MLDNGSSILDDNAVDFLKLVIESLRDETLALLSESSTYFEENALTCADRASEGQVLASREALRHAVRIKDLVAWTNFLHAWARGELPTTDILNEKNRLQFRAPASQSPDLSDQTETAQIRDLSRRGADLYQRACHLEDMLLDAHDIPSPEMTSSSSARFQ